MLRGLKQFNLPQIEEKVLKFWRENKIFEKSLALRQEQDKKPFRFYEGPPYANGRPGIHHVLARVFKDIILRYKSMAGYYVPRRAGWDTHGLPIELEAEKALGIKSKNEIEKFGVALFNQKARESIWRYKEEWERLTERIGYWLDLKNAYITYEPHYVESLWWIFKKIFEKGFLKQSYKVVPYCPRCQTPLSSHELGQPGAYQSVKDPSVYVKFALRQAQGKRAKTDEFLLVWTTTPWTLPANTAVAVNPKFTYTKFKISTAGKNEEYFWSFSAPPLKEGQKAEAVEKISGKKLIGLEYEPFYKNVKCQMLNVKCYSVLGADFVSTEEGTGLVHIAPAFGEDDFRIWEGKGDFPITVDDQGRVKKGFPGAGKFVKEADKDIIADLAKRGLLHFSAFIEHDYPFCWRCGTALLYFNRLSWFIEMSRLRDQLLANNQKINWIPAYLKEGRFGEWLKEAKDWAISRERYWGTPLPIWQCFKGHREVIGSLNELNEKRWSGNRFFILRHGFAEHNLKDVVASGPERGPNISRLTKEGIKQAEKAGAELKKAGVKFDAIYSSPYVRAKETAKIAVRVLGFKKKIIFDNRLVELNAGIFNWRPVKDHKKFFGSPLEEFSKRPPSGEHLNDARIRMFGFLKELNAANQGKNILIVSHGDPLWVLEGAVRHLKPEEILTSSYPAVGEWREISFDNWPVNAAGEVDLHRPFADEIYLKCDHCAEKMVRIPEVADVWFDSGAMPFAGVHYPFENKKAVDGRRLFPADYIAEGIDQTRGWFYTLLAVSVLLGKGAPYHNVISLGLVLDKYGQKMSKSKGNVVDPWQVIEKYGADACRWYFYTINPPAEFKRFNELDLAKTTRQFILLLYNSYVFYDTYADKSAISYKLKAKSLLDEWILARLNETILKTTAELENYEIGQAAKEIENLTGDLSRWYIRRSRRRFSAVAKGYGGQAAEEDFHQASFVLALVLREISKLLAPFAPFFSEALYLSLLSGSGLASVHLEDWPIADKKTIDKKLLAEMEETRRLASAALAKREEAGIKVRQPIASLKIKNQKVKIKNNEELLKILSEEVNVKQIIFDPKIKEEIELDTKITPELKEEGLLREVVRLVQGLRQDAGYQPKDKAILIIEAADGLNGILRKNDEALRRETGALKIEYQKSDKFDAELNTKIEGQSVWVGLRRF